MAEFSSGIKSITPMYPVKPMQPSQKGRKPGGQRKKRRDTVDDGKNSEGRDPDDKCTVDEHV